MIKDAVNTINLKRCPLGVIHGGVDNIGGDETITIGYSDHDDSNDEVDTRPIVALCIILPMYEIVHNVHFQFFNRQNAEFPKHSIAKKEKAK